MRFWARTALLEEGLLFQFSAGNTHIPTDRYNVYHPVGILSNDVFLFIAKPERHFFLSGDRVERSRSQSRGSQPRQNFGSGQSQTWFSGDKCALDVPG